MDGPVFLPLSVLREVATPASPLESPRVRFDAVILAKLGIILSVDLPFPEQVRCRCECRGASWGRGRDQLGVLASAG